jgi:polar amino acid transport system substrate-binding protein
MEEEPDASESDASEPGSSLEPSPVQSDLDRSASVQPLAPGIFGQRRPISVSAGQSRMALILLLVAAVPAPAWVRADGLERVRSAGRLVYGSDMEGGGPYAYPDPDAPRGITGFEVDLMTRLASELGVEPVFSQGQWDKLLQVLDSGRIDGVINGYEWTEQRARDYLATRPYYVYQLQLMVRRGSPVRSWSDLKGPKPGGGPWTVGVLVGSAADTFAVEQGGPNVRVVRFDGATDAMTAVQNGQYDATLQDLPAARFYAGRFPGLESVGPPESHGYYVIYVRARDRPLRDALDRAIARLAASGELRRLYERYGIWTEAQNELSAFEGPIEPVLGKRGERGWALLRRYLSPLVDAAFVTVALSVTSMPLAMVLGLFVAIGRLYGPRLLKPLLTGYVELIRGTPLMLQLFVLFYLVKLPPWVAGISGLAINYSAYEAEIYRAGLQAIPAGQMEAALALGMSRRMALWRVIVPQAVRIVIPPVTNDFIALFKDTSVCSVITLVELTKEYSILANSTGGAIEFALAAATLYMLMSVPLSWFSRWSERQLAGAGVKGGALA